MGVTIYRLACMLLLGSPLPATMQAAAARPPEIRVVLSDSKYEAELSGTLVWSAAGQPIGATTGSVKVQLTEQGVKATIAGKPVQQPRLVASPKDPRVPLTVGGRAYRGRIELFRGKSKGLVVLNILPFEDYLCSVVPSEMPAGWPEEALRAQAVAARTYALARMAEQVGATYDVYNSTADQVYSGVRSENERASKAVRDTAGQVLTYQGKPITAYFCSDAGGYTLAGKAPYLQCVPSSSQDSPYSSWSVAVTRDELAKLAQQAGTPVGQVLSVQAENHPQSGHLLSLTLQGTAGTCTLKAATLRKLLGLERMRSTLVHVAAASDGATLAGTVLASTGTAGGGSEAIDVAEPAAPAQIVADAPQHAADTRHDAADPQRDVADPPKKAVPILAVLNGWFKPWVAWRAGSKDLKLRGMVATDGKQVMHCNREVYARGADGTVAQPQAPVATPKRSAVPARQIPPRYGKPAPKAPPPSAVPAPRAPERGAGLSLPATGRGSQLAIGPLGIVLQGSGNGHGLGMSQYGAKQLAQEGKSYREILLYFYSGVQLTNWDGSLAAPAAPPEANSSGFFKPYKYDRR